MCNRAFTVWHISLGISVRFLERKENANEMSVRLTTSWNDAHRFLEMSRDYFRGRVIIWYIIWRGVKVLFSRKLKVQIPRNTTHRFFQKATNLFYFVETFTLCWNVKNILTHNQRCLNSHKLFLSLFYNVFNFAKRWQMKLNDTISPDGEKIARAMNARL